jgi:hypothetical protein
MSPVGEDGVQYAGWLAGRGNTLGPAGRAAIPAAPDRAPSHPAETHRLACAR